MQRRKTELQSAFLPLLFSVSLLISCSPEGETGDKGVTGNLDPAHSGSALGGQGALSSETQYGQSLDPVQPANNTSNILGGDSGAIDNNADYSPDSCASIIAKAKQIEIQVEKEVPYEVTEVQPVAIYIMLDQSGSMWSPDVVSIIVDPINFVNAFKWVKAVESITAFVNDPNSADINVALQTFPLAAAGTTCDGSVYNTPSVSMGRLPGNATAITDALGLITGGGQGTPIEPALRGAVDYCKQYKNDSAANPEGEDCVVIFITDGMPTEDCSQDGAVLAGIAGDAYTDDDVTTFAVGMAGADFNMLNLIAEKGQGDNDCHPDDPTFYCCNVSLPDMTLLKALELIRDYVVTIETRTEYETVIETEALECEWEIPAPPENETFDKDKVNVEYTRTGQTADATTIRRVDDETACGDAMAWHYDNMDNPTRIIACPQTCAAIQGSDYSSVDIVFGCEVVILQ